jgi:RHS repeat-associated protein
LNIRVATALVLATGLLVQAANVASAAPGPGDGGPAASAILLYPSGVAVDSMRNVLYLADTNNHRVRKVDLATGLITTVAGSGACSGDPNALGDGGVATDAGLCSPTGVVVDPEANVLYVADRDHNRLRSVNLSVPVPTIATVAGNGNAGLLGDGGPATQASLWGPSGVALSAGSLYIADTINHRVRKVDPAGTITTVAGSGLGAYLGDGQRAGLAALNHPTGVALDPSANLYIADRDNHAVRKVDPAGTITSVATNANLREPSGVTVASDLLYIADSGRNRVQILNLVTQGLSLLAGSGTYGFSGDGGAAAIAAVAYPAAVAVDAGGNRYVADRDNHRIRRIDTLATPRISTLAGSSIPAGVLGVLPLSPASAVWTASKRLTWTFSSPSGRPQTQFQVQLDDAPSFTSLLVDSGVVTSASGFWDHVAALVPGTTYYWRVRANDGTAWSDWASTSFRWDDVVPTGTLSSPANEAALSGTVPVTASASDAHSGVERMDLYATTLGRKRLVGTDTDGTDGWSVDLDTRVLPEGRAILSAEFADAAGNLTCCSPGAGITVVVNNATPAPERWAATVAADGASVGGADASIVLGTGQLALGVSDDVVPGRGFDASFERTYNSGSASAGILGRGWRASLEEALVPSYDGSVLHLTATGREHRFAPITASGLEAMFWNNTALSGAPALSRVDAQVDFAWGTGSPGVGVNADNFSARWKGLLDVPNAGSWTFYASTTDGTRVRVDGVYVVNNWRDQAVAEASGTVLLGAGLHEISMEYYEATGSASATLSWAGPGVAKQVIPAGRLARVTGYAAPAGIYDALGRTADGSFTLEHKGKVSARFTGDGLLDSLLDASGNTLRIGRDSQARPQYVCISTGTCGLSTAKLTLAYDENARLVGLADPYPRRWTYTYDVSGRLASVIDPHDNATNYAYDGVGRLLSIKDAELAEGRVTYDASGRVASVQDPRSVAAAGPPTTFSYGSGTATVRSPNANGMTPLGAGTVYTLGAAGQLLSMSDPPGSTTSRSWDGSFNVTSETDALGKVTTYVYDTRGSLTSETDPLGHARSYTYDADNNLISMTDPRGKITTYTYDSRGNLLSETDPLGKRRTYAYDAYGQKVSEVDPRGNEPGANPADYATTFGYDVSGNLTSVTNPLGNPTTYTYDPAGNQLTKTDPLGHTMLSTYDRLGNLLSVTDPAGNKSAFSYDRVGRERTRVSPVGNGAGQNPADYTTTTVYFPDGRVKSSTDPLGNTTNHAYDWNGNPTAETDPRGNQTVSTFDLADRLTHIQEAAGAGTTYAYDALSRTTAVSDPKGTTSYEYDDAGRLVATRGPRLSSGGAPLATTYTYDAAGNQLTVTTPAGNLPGAPPGSYTTTSAYDDAGRLITVTSALGGTTAYGYDAAGNQISVTDPAGATTSYLYDAAGRQVERRTPGSSRSTQSDLLAVGTPAWNLGWYWTVTTTQAGSISAALDWDSTSTDLDLWIEDGAGTAHLAEADDHSVRPETLVYPNASAGSYRIVVMPKSGSSTRFTLDFALPATESIRTTYDVADRTITETDAHGTTRYTHDAADRLIETAFPDNTTHRTEYDADDRATKIIDPAGIQTWSYDRAGRLLRASDQAGAITTYGYDGAGNEASVDRGTRSFTFSWDAQNRLLVRSGGGSSTFAYGDQMYRTETVHPAGDVDTRTFDPGGLITQVWLRPSAGAAAQAAVRYGYDAQGNLTTLEDVLTLPITLAMYDYDALDRLTSETFLLSGQSRSYAFGYDAQGNRTGVSSASGSTSFQYNPAGQLVSKTDPTGARTVYFHDASGNLTKAVTGGGASTAYGWTPQNLLAAITLRTSAGETSASYAYDALGELVSKTVGPEATVYSYERGRLVSQTTTGVGTATFTYDSDGVPLSITLPSGAKYAYRYDARGSVIQLTDQIHALAATYLYDAWGNIVSSSGPQSLLDSNPYTWLGQFGVRRERLSAVGSDLYLMRARFYDPHVGRFISRDPLEADPAQSSYSYADNNPTTRLDPSGLCTTEGDAYECASEADPGSPPPPPPPSPTPKKCSSGWFAAHPVDKKRVQGDPLYDSYLITDKPGYAGQKYFRGFHGGIDVHANGQQMRAPLVAICDGLVNSGQGNSWWGNWIQLAAKGLGTQGGFYAHLNEFTQRAGKVRAGQLIARMGMSGLKKGPHLHFEWRMNVTNQGKKCTNYATTDRRYSDCINHNKRILRNPYGALEESRRRMLR